MVKIILNRLKLIKINSQIVILFLLIAGNIYAQENTNKPFDNGVEFYSKQMYEEAISKFTEALKINPNNQVDIYLYRGRAYAEKGDFGKAISDYKKVIMINPGNAKAYFYRGISYSQLGEFKQAVLDYNKVVEIMPGYVEAYIFRAFSYGMLGQFNLAISDYRKAIDLDPGNAEAYRMRAFTYFYQREYAKSWIDVYKVQELGEKIEPSFLEELQKASGREK